MQNNKDTAIPSTSGTASQGQQNIKASKKREKKLRQKLLKALKRKESATYHGTRDVGPNCLRTEVNAAASRAHQTQIKSPGGEQFKVLRNADGSEPPIEYATILGRKGSTTLSGGVQPSPERATPRRFNPTIYQMEIINRNKIKVEKMKYKWVNPAWEGPGKQGLFFPPRDWEKYKIPKMGEAGGSQEEQSGSSEARNGREGLVDESGNLWIPEDLPPVPEDLQILQDIDYRRFYWVVERENPREGELLENEEPAFGPVEPRKPSSPGRGQA